MKNTILISFAALACLLASPTVKSSPHSIDTIVFDDDSGPLPPEYQWQSSTAISIDNTSKSVKVRYVRQAGCYACNAEETRKKMDVEVKLKGDWHSDFQRSFSEIRLCGLGEKPKQILLGAGDSRITIKGQGVDRMVKSGEAQSSDGVIFREYNVCSSDKELWDKLWVLNHEAQNAAMAFHNRIKPPIYRFYKAKGDGPASTLEIKADYLTRTAQIWGAKLVRPMDKDALRKFEALASSVNYYADKGIKDSSTLSGYDHGELFFDRGEGIYYPMDGGGMDDPAGKAGGVKGLKDFFAAHAVDSHS